MVNSIGQIDLVLGCMFSGKSTELIRRIRLYRLIKKNVLVVSHSADARYEASEVHVVTHNQDRERALKTSELLPIRTRPDYPSIDIIFIDEGQFFGDIVPFVKTAVDVDGKHVVVSALDGDFNRTPFENISHLISMADTYTKLTALCPLCCDGTPAIYSKLLKQPSIDMAVSSQVLVGGEESYMSVCRKHYLVAE
jgi:thymidine kinase